MYGLKPLFGAMKLRSVAEQTNEGRPVARENTLYQILLATDGLTEPKDRYRS